VRLGFSDLWVAGQKLHALSLNELGRAYAGTPSSNYLTEQKTRAVINSPILCELMCVCVLVFLCSSLIPAPVRPVLRLSLCCCLLINEYSLCHHCPPLPKPRHICTLRQDGLLHVELPGRLRCYLSAWLAIPCASHIQTIRIAEGHTNSIHTHTHTHARTHCTTQLQTAF